MFFFKYFNLNLSPSFGKPPTIQNIFLFFSKEYLHASKLVALESLIIEILFFYRKAHADEASL